ncbi:MAG: DUF4003 domain-containing protein [Ruminococcaceae bacterium]|nr:DUF4003 domain-containing protein [Oscillospiraceae bacterium]
MNANLAQLCRQFIENRDIIKSTFAWESSYIYPVCAAIFTDQRVTAEREKLLACREILKSRTGVFSNFRGNPRLTMISKMALSEDPNGKLGRALELYAALKKHFMASEYLPVASMVLSELTDPGQYAAISARTRHIYELMKAEHPFLTSGEDSVFASLLSLSSLEDESIVSHMEVCYQLLKPQFFSHNAVQSLSHVLALCAGSAEEKCSRTLELFAELKARNCPYGTGYELPTLGVLAMLPGDHETMVQELIETDAWLGTQRGYGVFGPGRRQRLMHAGMLVTSDRLGQENNAVMGSAAMSAAVSMIAAQQAAICAAIAATSAAQAASN